MIGSMPSLASLSGALIRAVEVRGKMGGAINENPQISLTVSLGELHQRLDGILGSDQAERQNAARNLLGLASPAPMPTRATLDAQADPPTPRRRDSVDPTNPQGEALTIDAKASPADPAAETPFEEPIGTRWR